ncbi:MAG: hypothetical protein JO131_09600, partial [Gammaproteobacteria bacterium]|nr:hypothetical protein [Gammaproteobacteria bacterium]
MQRNFTHTINPEEKTNSQSYIQQLLSYPKKSFIYSKAVLKPYVESLSYRKIADSIKLIVALNALDYLPKVKADEIYVLLDKIHYALSFDKTGPLHTLTTQLL